MTAYFLLGYRFCLGFYDFPIGNKNCFDCVVYLFFSIKYKCNQDEQTYISK